MAFTIFFYTKRSVPFQKHEKLSNICATRHKPNQINLSSHFFTSQLMMIKLGYSQSVLLRIYN